MDYQRIFLVGNATGNAETKTSKSGGVTYSSFSLATSDIKGRKMFFPVAAFGNAAEVAKKYVTKGRQLLLEGRIALSGEGRFNVVADRIVLGYSNEKPEPETTQ
jgi:single-stranded DNA-binding protein